jgi:hypothetical protein
VPVPQAACSAADTGFLTKVIVDGTVVERCGYDGNRIRFDASVDSATATYDAQDRMLRYKNAAYRYSAAGEVTRAIIDSDTTLYTYHPLGNLLAGLDHLVARGRERGRYSMLPVSCRVPRAVNPRFRITVGSEPDYDDLVCDLYLDERILCVDTQEEGFEVAQVELFAPPGGAGQFALRNFEEALFSLKKRMCELQRGDSSGP